MDEGGDVPGRQTKVCSPCHAREEQIKARVYCDRCEAFFCHSCSSQHQQLLSQHQTKEIDEGGPVNTDLTPPTSLGSEPCQQHSKTIDLYCENHDEVGCSTCMALSHRSCSQVVYLPGAAKETIKDVDFGLLEKLVDGTIQKLESIKVTQKATLSKLKEDKERCIYEIDDYHSHLLDHMDHIVKDSKDSVQETFENMRSEIQMHFENVEGCILNLENDKLQLQNELSNDVQKFITVKNCHKQLSNCAKVSADAVESVQVKGITVSMDKRLETLLSELETLITVVRRMPYEVIQSKVDVSVSEDSSVCDIHGTCVLTDGSVLLADWNNRMIKRLDSSALKITEKCLLKENPIDVCTVGDDKAAVTFGNKTVGLFAVKPSLAATQTFTLNHHCGYIAYSERNLFITNTSNVMYIYNMDGVLLKMVSASPSGQDMFARTRHVAISRNGEWIYVADMDRGLIALDQELRAVVRFAANDKTGAYGVCTDGGAGVFMCGYTSNNVVHVDPEGGPQGKMLNRARAGISNLSHWRQKVNFGSWKMKLAKISKKYDFYFLGKHCSLKSEFT